MPTVFTITTTSDLPILDGKISLREAMVAANTNAPYFDAPAGSAIVPDFINFNIPGAGVHTFKPFTDLPKITDSLIINGYSQPGSSINTLVIGNNAKLLIELNGSLIAGGNHSGLDIGAPTSPASKTWTMLG